MLDSVCYSQLQICLHTHTHTHTHTNKQFRLRNAHPLVLPCSQYHLLFTPFFFHTSSNRSSSFATTLNKSFSIALYATLTFPAAPASPTWTSQSLEGPSCRARLETSRGHCVLCLRKSPTPTPTVFSKSETVRSAPKPITTMDLCFSKISWSGELPNFSDC